MSGDRIHSMNPDGSDRKTIVTGCHLPDGIVVDSKAGTSTGPTWASRLDDGSIKHMDLNGGNRKMIVPQSRNLTAKQIKLDRKNRQALLVRSRRNARDACKSRRLAVENIVETAHSDEERLDQAKWCVGMALDPSRSEGLLDAKRPQQRRAGQYPAREHRDSEGRDPDESLRYRSALRWAAGADRYRTRLSEPCHVLDGPRRSS